MDSLQEIHDNELPKLLKLYEKQLPFALHMYNFIRTTMEFKKRGYIKDYYIKIFTQHGKVTTDGTFIGIVKNFCYDIIACTLDQNNTILYETLRNTKMIKPKEDVIFYGVNYEHYITVIKVLTEIDFPLHLYHTELYDVWWIEKDIALEDNMDVPKELYIEKLTSKYVRTINDCWPLRYPNSEGYISSFIETTGGYGLFLKHNHQLVAWALRNHMGALAFLQTAEGHMRKGYGALIAQHVTKVIARAGYNPVAIIAKTNIPSKNTFKKLGFSVLDTVAFVET